MDFSDIKHELKALDFKRKTNFSGSSPPEIFVGKYGYPNIYSGILSPIKCGNTESFSSPERWFEKKLEIKEILEYRKQLIYSRFKTKVKDARIESNLHNALNQVSMAKKSVSAEFFLNKPPKFKIIKENSIPIIGNHAPLKRVRLEENPKIEKKVDYIVSDTRLKAAEGIKELYKNRIETSNIIKVLSAGLLGLNSQRKLVPTRWSITTVDDTLSKEQLLKIRTFKEINDLLLFHGEYLGNRYEILLLPDKWSFEVIEIAETTKQAWQDHEFFFPRKKYADNVTGGYYAIRLGITEFLLKNQRQATVLVFREVGKEYNAPLGVGILRELGRGIFQKQGKKFQTIDEALTDINTRFKLDVSEFTNKSVLLQEFGKQKRLNEWF